MLSRGTGSSRVVGSAVVVRPRGRGFSLSVGDLNFMTVEWTAVGRTDTHQSRGAVGAGGVGTHQLPTCGVWAHLRSERKQHRTAQGVRNLGPQWRQNLGPHRGGPGPGGPGCSLAPGHLLRAGWGPGRPPRPGPSLGPCLAQLTLAFLSPSRRLDANLISLVPERSFEGLSRLRHLWLDDNALTEVPVRALNNLPALQAMTLALNRISHVPDYAFQNLSSLVVL